MVFALLRGYAWQFADYRAQGRRELQVIAQRFAPQRQALDFVALPSLPLPDVSPLQVAQLHANDVHAAPLNTLIVEQPQATAQLAQDIWAALSTQEPALLQLLGSLETLWSHALAHADYRHNQITLPWQTFLGAASPPAAQLRWLRRLHELAPQQLHWDERSITLPGNHARKQSRALRDWVSGAWLEQLAHQWLMDAGVPAKAVACNLKSGLVADNSNAEREADLLVHYRGTTCLIEAKADLPPGGKPAELERQVSSLGDRFGKTRKLLLAGPQLQDRLRQGNRWCNFELRCKASGVTLCTDRQSLLNKVIGTPH